MDKDKPLNNVFNVSFLLSEKDTAIDDFVNLHKSQRDKELDAVLKVADSQEKRAHTIIKRDWVKQAQVITKPDWELRDDWYIRGAKRLNVVEFYRTALVLLTNPEEVKSFQDMLLYPMSAGSTQYETTTGKVFKPVGNISSIWQLSHYKE